MRWKKISQCRCVDGLFEALTQIYNDQEASIVRRLTQSVAAAFAKGSRFADNVELEELKQLKADAQASRILLFCLFVCFTRSACLLTFSNFLSSAGSVYSHRRLVWRP